MLKKNKTMLILSSIIILLPALAGLILWNRLPDEIATHFNAEGVADGYSSKTFAVFGLPGIMFGLHWLCLAMTSIDPKYRNIEGKPLSLIFWLCPAISLLSCGVVLAGALNIRLNVGLVMMLFMGALFIIIGNYLPKCKQNYSLGVKTPWALHSEENWNRTHRFSGRLWTVCGALMMLLSFTASIWVCTALLIAMAALPLAYSYLYFRKHRPE